MFLMKSFPYETSIGCLRSPCPQGYPQLSTIMGKRNVFVRLPGIEPGSHSWQERILPLNYSRIIYFLGLKPLFQAL